jgi:hypothetical protein
VEKYGRASKVRDDSIMWCRTDMVCMLDHSGKNTDPHSEYAVLNALPW